jgi:hypothetical protein
MQDKNYKFVAVTEHVSIPVPLGLTEEQEAEYVRRFLAHTSPEELEAEAREWEQLLRDYEEGRTIPAEQVLQELEALLRGDAEPDGDAQ